MVTRDRAFFLYLKGYNLTHLEIFWGEKSWERVQEVQPVYEAPLQESHAFANGGALWLRLCSRLLKSGPFWHQKRIQNWSSNVMSWLL